MKILKSFFSTIKPFFSYILVFSIAIILTVSLALNNLKLIPDNSTISESRTSDISKNPDNYIQSSSINTEKSIVPKHFLYSEAPENRLILINSYAKEPYQRFEFLHEDAGKSLMKMIYSARDEGVWIVPVSGFRTIEKQEKLFNNQVQRYGSPEAAARVSAPPGYSEHHTGYAIDLADGNVPKQDITQEFVNTKAYEWLTTNAKEFGFELSFPLNNSQGVNFEPWHWRFTGSKEAKEIFSRF
ncbi:M15 family metallopeptidase [Spirulina sp. 06S082]|uniref:M15 family metallopeptidase n=1 Tax=Spirulina sp. 06S082 TaxID=3110248 RepID=UPI002B1F9549|nr:M15 family metallopeptidase [Spirulina sp. 06S082]